MCVSGIGLMVAWAELKSSSKSLSFRQYAACECSETNTFFLFLSVVIGGFFPR